MLINGERVTLELQSAEGTPWDVSVTVSRSGHLVALMRLRNSVSSASGTFTLQGSYPKSAIEREGFWMQQVGSGVGGLNPRYI